MLRATLFPATYNNPLPVLTRGATQATTCHSLPPPRAVYPRSSLASRFQFQLHSSRQPRVIIRAARGASASSSSRRRGRGVARTDEDEFEYYDDDDEDDVVLGGSDYDEDEDEGEYDIDDGDEEEMLPLEQMRKWFSKKPKGFGEGKEYDTSVEDKLLEEMRQSREAQAKNLLKLKSGSVKPADSDRKKKDSQVVPIGGRVRLLNLPKKKNIHRDLKVAFEGIPGIANIVPAVTGNKKTRDPVCKGFAFVDFKRETDAVRFVELYSGQTIAFGKNQKQIKCELVNTRSNEEEDIKAAPLKLRQNIEAPPHLKVSAVEEVSNEDSNMEGSALGSWDGTTSDDSDDMDNQIYVDEEEDVEENQDSATALMGDHSDSVVMSFGSEINPLTLEQVNRNPTVKRISTANEKQENARKKKQAPKEKTKKISKIEVLGSAKRLKIKEKAILSDVFSKYGSKASLDAKGW